ncbi:MAG: hypothetical protein Q605_AUC01068G0003 [Actinomyces urogenitalis DORA_12]|uniref:Uncharacterized protein n=1 Tax=Actinomyces urogenitalis DORA_12 TaxID=1403939 RepID=W1V9S1_9ACTO|nr:MAG: hypothetical protein Q605_AUC01068G0003 [Actinomyces urogenitalis DORA_12]
MVPLVDPLAHGRQVASRAGLVAQRPEDDGGVVLVPLDHAAGTVEQGLAPGRLVSRIALPADGLEAVGLQVALVHDPQADLVSQVQQARVRGVVRGADGIDVVGLHQSQIRPAPLLVEDASAACPHLVAVDPGQNEPLSVDAHLAVDHLDAAEARTQSDGLAGGTDIQLVQARDLGAPGLDGARLQDRQPRTRQGGAHPELGQDDLGGEGRGGA